MVGVENQGCDRLNVVDEWQQKTWQCESTWSDPQALPTSTLDRPWLHFGMLPSSALPVTPAAFM